MKRVFKCDYCSFMGTYKDMKVHEPSCVKNYKRKSCYTCQFRCLVDLKHFQCACGENIPEDGVKEFCKSYERQATQDSFASMFSLLRGDKKNG